MTPHLRRYWPVILLMLAVPLAFAWFTGHAWEDYFITLRTSRNLVEGNGLVFNSGERVHTFTSPLGVLLPALCSWLAGASHESLALWFFRFINAGLLAVAALFVCRRSETLGLGRFGRFVFFGLLAADAKLADFASNGMETGILVFFVLLLWSELEAPVAPRALPIAIACAGLMWTRPDAFILGAALMAPHFFLRRRGTTVRPRPWRPLLRGVLLGAALYLPWFVFAWWYYGSPIPHTIVAKSVITPRFQLHEFLLLPWRTLIGDSFLTDLFLPTYWYYGGWPSLLHLFGHVLSVAAAFAWFCPALPGPARRASLSVFCGMFYVCAIIPFPWYLPPWTALAALALAFTFDDLLARARRLSHPSFASVTRVVGSLAVGVQVAVLLAAAWQMRIQQRLVENDGRREIGRWLHATAAPGDTVFLEPLGYIGYYSGLKTFDVPGLSSPEVVAAMRGGAVRFASLIERLHPTWLVLRPFEIADPRLPENAALRSYRLVRTWNARPRLDAIAFLPGRAWLEHDSEFRVFRRITGAAQPAAQ